MRANSSLGEYWRSHEGSQKLWRMEACVATLLVCHKKRLRNVAVTWHEIRTICHATIASAPRARRLIHAEETCPNASDDHAVISVGESIPQACRPPIRPGPPAGAALRCIPWNRLLC